MRKSAVTELKFQTVRFPNPDGSFDIWTYDVSRRPYRVIEVTVNTRKKDDAQSQHSKKKQA